MSDVWEVLLLMMPPFDQHMCICHAIHYPLLKQLGVNTWLSYLWLFGVHIVSWCLSQPLQHMQCPSRTWSHGLWRRSSKLMAKHLCSWARTSPVFAGSSQTRPKASEITCGWTISNSSGMIMHLALVHRTPCSRQSRPFGKLEISGIESRQKAALNHASICKCHK